MPSRDDPSPRAPIDLHARVRLLERDVGELKTWKGEVESTENAREDQLRHVTKDIVAGATRTMEQTVAGGMRAIGAQLGQIQTIISENQEQTKLLGDLKLLADAAQQERIERSTREKIAAEQAARDEKKLRDKKGDAEVEVMLAEPRIKRMQIVFTVLTPVVLALTVAITAAITSQCSAPGHAPIVVPSAPVTTTVPTARP